MEFKDWLIENMQKKGVNPTTLAMLIDENQPTVQRIVSGETKNPRLKIIKKLEHYFGVSFNDGSPITSGEYDLGIAIDLHANDDYPSIRRVSLKLSAGITGYAIESDIDDKTPLVFSKNWFTKNGYNPRALLAVEVQGESMQPSLYDGDTVTINTADTTPKDGEVYAINYEGELLIKRLVRDDGVWWLSSDNSDQRKYIRKKCEGEACIILGKIVHKQSERI